MKKEDDIYTLKVGDTVSWWNRNADIDNTGSEIKDVKIIQVNEDGTYNISVNDNTDDERYKNVENSISNQKVLLGQNGIFIIMMASTVIVNQT